MDKIEIWHKVNGHSHVDSGDASATSAPLTRAPSRRVGREADKVDICQVYRNWDHRVRPEVRAPENPAEYLELARLLFSELMLQDGAWLDERHRHLDIIPDVYAADYLLVDLLPMRRFDFGRIPIAVDPELLRPKQPPFNRPASPLMPEGARPAMNQQPFLNKKERLGPVREEEIPLRLYAIVKTMERRQSGEEERR